VLLAFEPWPWGLGRLAAGSAFAAVAAQAVNVGEG
jgi:hypothetical protein